MADNKTTVNVNVTQDGKPVGAEAAAAEASAAAAATAETAAEAAVDNGRDVEAEIADLKEKLLHALADMENLRRRTEREVADARKYAVTGFARELLTVGDNLRRALDAVPDELRQGEDGAAKALIEGVAATERSLEQALEKFGVKRIEAAGQKFDPAFHQAMMEVEDETAEPGTVAQEMQTGYAIGDRVLRPAFVSVVKKTKKPAPAEAAGSEAANNNG